MAQKKHKLDQSAILAGEPTGGWGRTIGGADTLTQKMLKNPDTAIEASESKTHLDLVRLCRTMQPTKIEGTLQDDLDQGLSALEWARDILHDCGSVASQDEAAQASDGVGAYR